MAHTSYFRALQGDFSAGREQQEPLPDLLQLAEACRLYSRPKEECRQQSNGKAALTDQGDRCCSQLQAFHLP